MNERLSILLLTQFYPPIIGGVEVHAAALARGLSSRGHVVSVATLAGEGLDPLEEVDGVRVHRLQGGVQRLGFMFSTERRHAIPVPDPELVLALRRIVRDTRPDIVHAHNWLGRSFVPLKKRSGARYVVTLHDCGRTCAQGRMMFRNERLCDGPGSHCTECCAAHFGKLKGALTLAGNRAGAAMETAATDCYVAVSAAIDKANELRWSGVRHEVVPNFYEDPGSMPLSEAPGGLPTGPFILQVGDVVPDKGVDVLLAAWERAGRPAPLVLMGRIDEERARRLPRGVTATGPKPHAFVRQAWRRALFGTVPSLCLDASPTVTLEAMAASKPVIASALGGLVDQVDDGRTGYLVAPGDVEALAGAMRKLAGDAALRGLMGHQARERYERCFSAGVVIDRIEGLYGSLLNRS